MTKRISFKVHGQVQGVGFRYFTRENATSHNVTGWARNTRDDKVEGEAQGDDSALETFMGAVSKGPSYARVTKVEKEEIAVVDGEKGFEVRR